MVEYHIVPLDGGKAMSQKDDRHTKKPWENTFEDEKDEQGNYLRTASRKSSHKNAVLTNSLLVVFVVIVIGTIALYFISQKTANKTFDDNGNVEVVSSTAKKSSKKKVAAKKSSSESESAASESSQAESSSQEESQASSQASESSQSTSSESSSSQDEQYVTVQAGQGLYRVATNNGLTVNELLNLNPGLTANSTLTPGQQIRVK